VRKVIFFFVILINLYTYNSDDSILSNIQNKIIYGLNCNAKFSSISEVEINHFKLVSETNNSKIYDFFGTYKSVLSASFHFKGIGIGDEFHPINGSFKARVKIDKNTGNVLIEQIFYKISFKKGYVVKQCLVGD